MCGIAGFSWEDASLISRMGAALAHRGPDDWDCRVGDGFTLGHRRLSILDLSRAGRNPLPSDDGRCWVVHNGEIYNFGELRKELESAGRRFRGRSDTEVVANAFAEWGPRAVERFRGMFATAVLDCQSRRLYLARDRLGIKPLYFSTVNGRFAFASEIKALLCHPDLTPEVDGEGLFQYMGLEFVPSPRTMFRDVRALEPGHLLTVHADGRCESERYWSLDWEPKLPLSRQEAEQQLLGLLRQSVELRLQADVPVGVFLSGGIDSSALVALMAELVDEPIPAFTLMYDDESFSELPFAEQVARRFNLEHHVLEIEPIRPETLAEAVWHLDQPMTDLSAVPFYLISKRARERVTVALSGEGGDEIFAGYDRFRASRLDRALSWLPGPLRRQLLHRPLHALHDRPEKKGAVNMLKRFVEGSELPDEGGAMRWQYFLPPRRAEALFRPEVIAAVDRDPFAPMAPHREHSRALDALDRDLDLDLAFTMPDSLLMKVDKMSMAHGLEVRVPLLDHEVVEFAAKLPADWKLHRFETKSILRSTLSGLLPDEILRRGKQGYSIPIKNWLRNEMQTFTRDVLDRSELVRRFFRRDAVDGLWDEHLAHRANHNHLLWSLLNASLWHERFIEGKPTP